MDIDQYAPFGIIDPAGDMLIGLGRGRQDGSNNAIDADARLEFNTGPFSHRIVGGYTWVSNNSETFSSNASGNPVYNILLRNPTPPRRPARATGLDLQIDSSQNGIYGQYILKAWKLSLVASVRNNQVGGKANNLILRERSEDRTISIVHNFNAVLDGAEASRCFYS